MTMHRLDDRIWAFPLPEQDRDIEVYGNPKIEVRLHADDYLTAEMAYKAVHRIGVQNLSERGAILQLDGDNRFHWKIERIHTASRVLRALARALPFFYRLEPPHAIDFEVSRREEVPAGCFAGVGLDDPYYINISPAELEPMLQKESLPLPPLRLSEALKREAFSDSFTSLSALAFQKWEKEFTTRSEASPNCQLIVDGEQLSLEPLLPGRVGKACREKNRKTMELYRNFIEEEYGASMISVLEYRFGMNLNQMYERGEPLTPELVHRINVGVNNIEIQEVESLFQKLYPLREDLKNMARPEENLLDFFEWYQDAARPEAKLSVREMRGLKTLIEGKEVAGPIKASHLLRFLDDLLDGCNGEHHCPLSTPAFDSVMKIVWPTLDAWKRIFTGREILHKAIMGFYTVADKDTFKPWLDQQELFQIFPECTQAEDWTNFYERLAHIVCKKHMVRAHPKDLWRVGAIIPAPNTEGGQGRWYIITSCLDDHQGDYNYTLEPATRDSQLPFIKLYRSTASSRYAMNGWASVESDLNPSAAPGGHNRWAGDQYEMPYIRDRTIPIWVGYLLMGQRLTPQNPPASENWLQLLEAASAWRDTIAAYRSAAVNLCKTELQISGSPVSLRPAEQLNEEQVRYEKKRNHKTWQRILAHIEKATEQDVDPLPIDETHENLELLKEQVQRYQSLAAEYHEMLDSLATVLKERPEDKIQQDVVFVGHSLGGSLAQGGFFHFTVDGGRMAVPGHNLECRALGCPSLNPGENRRLIAFGNEHQDLLKYFNQRWKVRFLFEWADIVPMGGSRHIGAVNKDQPSYSEWLDMKAQIFRPMPTATALEIYDPPTHGRRTGQAQEGFDYQLTDLTPKQLFEHDSAWLLSRAEQELWGYSFWVSPKGVEGTRRVLGFIQRPFSKLGHRIRELVDPPRGHEFMDENKYFFVELKHDGTIHLEPYLADAELP